VNVADESFHKNEAGVAANNPSGGKPPGGLKVDIAASYSRSEAYSL
jgi:hypothetical protein